MDALPLLLSLSLLAAADPVTDPAPDLAVPADAAGEAGFVAGTLAIALRHCGASQDQLAAFHRFEQRQAATDNGQATAFDAGFRQGSEHMHAAHAAGQALPDAAVCQQLQRRLPRS